MTHFVPFGVFFLLPGLECRGASGSGCRWNGATSFSCTQTAKNAAIRGSASDRYTHTHTHTHTHTDRQTDKYIFRGSQIPEVFLLYFLWYDWLSPAAELSGEHGTLHSVESRDVTERSQRLLACFIWRHHQETDALLWWPSLSRVRLQQFHVFNCVFGASVQVVIRRTPC